MLECCFVGMNCVGIAVKRQRLAERSRGRMPRSCRTSSELQHVVTKLDKNFINDKHDERDGCEDDDG